MFIRTERLFLRPAWPEDLDDIVEALSGDAVARTSLQFGPAHGAVPRSAGDLQGLLESEHSQRLPQFMMYLRAPGGARLVGGIGLIEAEADVELVYWIKAAFSGLGYAREAVRAMLDHARSLGHARIVAWQPIEDEADTRVLLAAGFEDTFQVEERFSPGQGEALPVRRFEVALQRRRAPLSASIGYSESLSA